MIDSLMRRGCRVGFFGLGESNIALLSCLPLENSTITLRSDGKINTEKVPSGIKIEKIYEGGSAYEKINEDILFFSPSVRRDRAELAEARARGVIFSSDAELFFERNTKPIFAVTGSDGKSTTATLIHLLLEACGKKSRLIGNIGEPMARHLDSDADCFVCELSSFMLTYACPRARRGCITNITPNHLDWHRDFAEYKKTKISLVERSGEFVISEENSEISGAFAIVSDRLRYSELKKKYKAELYLTLENGRICRNGEGLIDVENIALKESYNIKNLMTAIAMTDGYANKEAIGRVAADFKGLPHRCERFCVRGGVEYINSSIDSTPARTVQTLDSLKREVVIILGGRSKGLNYQELAPAVKKYAKRVVIVGENAEEIYNAICKVTKAEVMPDFETAVLRGKELARDVGTLLLSPASTSYDAFKNYAERGDKFKEIIQKSI